MAMTTRIMIGVDIGSGSFKTTAVNNNGEIIDSASSELTTKYPYQGWSEQNPEEWYSALCETLKKIFSRNNIKKRQIASICIDSTPHTAVLLGKENNILRPSILWTDQRSKNEVDWLNENYYERIFSIAYNKASPTWTLPQLLWIKNNEPKTFENIDKVLIAKDYLRYRLCDQVAIDYIDAMGTLLFDAENKIWSDEICGFIGLPPSTLPEIVYPKDVVGYLNKTAAEDTGLPDGLPIVAGTTDTAIEALGSGAIYPGQGVVKLATAGNANVVSARAHPHEHLFNYYHVVPGRWYILTGTNSCASAHKWLKDQFFRLEMKQSKTSEETFLIMDDLAKTIQPGCDGLIFHPYLLGERSPYYDPYLRADFLGITMRHNYSHFVRAVYEGIAYSIRDCFSLLTNEGLTIEEVRIIGGGAKSDLWRQIIADVLGLEVIMPKITDAAFGAAILGGVGVGIFPDEVSAVKKCVKVIGSNKPKKGNHQKYSKIFKIYKESQKVLAKINHDLRSI